jgi:hypothetical protein
MCTCLCIVWFINEMDGEKMESLTEIWYLANSDVFNILWTILTNCILIQWVDNYLAYSNREFSSCHNLGLFYTRTQGQCSKQIQHSYWCKSWNQPQGLYTRSQGWHRKKLFNLPQVTNKCWTLWPCFGPKAEKRISSNLGGQFTPLRPMFQHLTISNV